VSKRKTAKADGKFASTLKMEAVYSFEMLGCLRAIRLYNPEDCDVLCHRRENPKY
jgi:hypothetical protein